MRASELPLYYNAVEILEHNLPERAEKTALFSPSRNLTFQELSEEANQVGNALLELWTFLAVQLPATIISAIVGVWMFYVQHQFEHTYWAWHGDWDYYDASLYGSSHLVLPKPLQWISGNIGIHHVHHMSARIPNYKLQQAHDENPEFHEVTEVRFRDTLELINLALWDEEEQRLIRFSDLKRVRRDRALDRAA